MNLTLEIDEQTLREARQTAEAMGKNLNQLVREYIESLTPRASRARLVEEIERLSRPPQGHSKGWKFNRDEIHERT